jgi:hypothetical protein
MDWGDHISPRREVLSPTDRAGKQSKEQGTHHFNLQSVSHFQAIFHCNKITEIPSRAKLKNDCKKMIV